MEYSEFEKNKRERRAYILLDIAEEIFKISFIAYILFYLLDNMWNGFLSEYVNLTILLNIAIVSGLVTVIFNSITTKKIGEVALRAQHFWAIIVSLIMFTVLYLQLREIGIWAWLISCAGVAVFYLLFITFNSTVIED